MKSGTDELTSLTFRAGQDLVNGVPNPNDTVGGIDTTYSKPPSTFFSGELLRKPRSSFAKRWWGLALVVCVLPLSYRHSPTVHFVLSRCSSKTIAAWNKRVLCRRQCFGIGFLRCEENMASVLGCKCWLGPACYHGHIHASSDVWRRVASSSQPGA